jgi:HK97 family phage major capsid protein
LIEFMTKRTQTPGSFERTFSITRAIDAQARTVELAFSSEEPYERWWGVEILDHAAGSVDLTRLNDGRHPLLLNHDTEDQIGVVESVSIGTDRVGRAVVRFGRSELAEEIFQDVQDGIRSLVSVGYMINEMEADEKNADGEIVTRKLSFTEFQAEMRSLHGDDCFERAQLTEREADPVFRVTGWTPFEISLVSIPADPTVGVGRSVTANIQTTTTAEPEVSATTKEIKKMDTTVQVTDNGAQAEKVRMQSIRQTADSYAQYDVKDLALEFIATGKSAEEFGNAVMQKMATKHTADTGAAHVGLSKKETQRYSVLRAIRALTDKDWTHAGFERECHNEILKRAGMGEAPNNGFFMPVEVQQRDLTAGTANAGGYAVATDNLSGSFIDLLRNRAVIAQLGATMLDGLQGNVTIPKQTGAGTAYWLANEATAITESQLTLGQLALTPKNVGAYTEISRQLMLQSSPSADALVMNDLARVLALAVDLAAINGSGASGQPTGIIGTAGIGSVTGTTLGYAGILEFQTDVAGSNALAANCAYLTTPAVAALLSARQRFSSTDTPLWTGNILDGQVSGFRGAATNQMPAANMLFGDFSQIIIGSWGMLEIALNPYANFTAAITGVRAIQTVDVGVRVPGAFSLATSIT